jgi:hypothetical protein
LMFVLMKTSCWSRDLSRVPKRDFCRSILNKVLVA